jgi:hypothetical protein
MFLVWFGRCPALKNELRLDEFNANNVAFALRLPAFGLHFVSIWRNAAKGTRL